MIKGLRGALFAPLVAALLLLGAPTATFAGSAPRANPAISARSALRLNHKTDISTIVCLRQRACQAVSIFVPPFQL